MEGFAIIGGIVMMIAIPVGVVVLLTGAGLARSRHLKARDAKSEEI